MTKFQTKSRHGLPPLERSPHSVTMLDPPLPRQWLAPPGEQAARPPVWEPLSICLQVSPLLRLRGSPWAHDSDHWRLTASSPGPLPSRDWAEDFCTQRTRIWHSWPQTPVCLHPCWLGQRVPENSEEIQIIDTGNSRVAIHEATSPRGRDCTPSQVPLGLCPGQMPFKVLELFNFCPGHSLS